LEVIKSCFKSGCFLSSPLVTRVCCPSSLWCRHLRDQRYVLPQTLMAFSQWNNSSISSHVYLFICHIQRNVIIIQFHFIFKYLHFQEKGTLNTLSTFSISCTSSSDLLFATHMLYKTPCFIKRIKYCEYLYLNGLVCAWRNSDFPFIIIPDILNWQCTYSHSEYIITFQCFKMWFAFSLL